jgi:hypothetical protein
VPPSALGREEEKEGEEEEWGRHGRRWRRADKKKVRLRGATAKMVRRRLPRTR